MKYYIIFVLLGICLIIPPGLNGQHFPVNTGLYPIITPQLLNPAFTGSKDISRINLTSNVNGTRGAQLTAFNSRIRKNKSRYLSSGYPTFSNIGIGGHAFHDRFTDARYFGAGISTAYHISLGKDKVSGLAFGLTAKGFVCLLEENEIPNGESTRSIVPDADLGIFYYGSRGFIGISSTNILEYFSDTSSVALGSPYFPNKQLLYGGYKFLLSARNEIVVEPSILISIRNFTLNGDENQIIPYVKVYIQNACVGSYFKDLNSLALFLQYQFPRIYTGIFVEFPRNEMLISSDQLTIDFTLGLKLGSRQYLHNNPYQW